ncbi:MAG: SpoIID/LytB domain-containing protein [Bacteroidales bacterium]|nr:SpoIID/LytB domain-containing protein [Bacteroidales bacterium]
MYNKLYYISVLLFFQTALLSGQVKIRLFSSYTPESAVFSVTEGEYELNSYNDELVTMNTGDMVIVSRYKGKLTVKIRNSEGYICDSVLLTGKTGKDKFSLRINSNKPVRQFYSGDLLCLPDLGTLLFINTCNIEDYIAGVVRSEGRSGKSGEYFNTQAIIARTYMYKYFDRHINDNYNLCDNTHCQAYNGLSFDTAITSATLQTKGLVIFGPDSSLINAAFHSNCGGETSPSEDVWLSGHSYLKKIADLYCLNSPNARWQQKISLNDWTNYMRKSGYTGTLDNPSVFSFAQKSRLLEYNAGTFTLPLLQIRTDLNLRSTFFSLTVEGDSVLLKGKGYGHGVGLCQEGAMVMAAKGYNFRQIIDFYYQGVRIEDIRNATIKK